nr:hypothetical protein [Streptomyces sp. JS01]
MVSDDGREYYAVALKLADPSWRGRVFRRKVRQHTWLMENVVPNLPQPHGDWRLHMPERWLFNYRDPAVKSRPRIAREVAEFIRAAGPDVELWANYGAYDHVALAQLWGPTPATIRPCVAGSPGRRGGVRRDSRGAGGCEREAAPHPTRLDADPAGRRDGAQVLAGRGDHRGRQATHHRG